MGEIVDPPAHVSVFPQAAVGKAMSKLCYILPGAVAGICQCLMEKYTVIIVDTIVSKLGPRLICGMMFMCASEENCGPGTKVPMRLFLFLFFPGQVMTHQRTNKQRARGEEDRPTPVQKRLWPKTGWEERRTRTVSPAREGCCSKGRHLSIF